MSQEMFWLILTALMTSLFWVPYVLNRMVVRGIVGAMANPSPDAKAQPEWAERARKAQSNAIENLVIFAALVLALEILKAGSALTATACAVYFWARLAHFIVYTAGIPVIRTVAFLGGWAVQVVLALVLLGVL
ncbi:MAG: MAPEG family protein [Alphaproteobacteria bacterium]